MICRLFSYLILLLAVVLTPIGEAAAEKRVALVVGIAKYETVPVLKNTINDSRLIEKSLQELDFEVTTLVDTGLLEFRAAIKRFAFEAEIADVALVYFAGHGVEVGGKNFLIPADNIASSRNDVAFNSVSLDEVLHAVDKARQLRIVILDSCRNDPFETSGNSQIVSITSNLTPRSGLASPSPERGTLVAFAAEDGKIALDGVGNNSPFATALAENLATPDLEIGLMFRRVRDAVLRSTGNKQEPHTYGSLSGKPYFLAGLNQTINTLDKLERRNAWSRLNFDQEEQLSALANEGDTRALNGLAYMRLDPNEKRYDPTKAAEFLTKAVEAGDAEAQFELGRLYEKGVGVDQDIERAIELFMQAAVANFPDAINDLGFLHFQGGQSIVRDPKKAIEYFAKAAELRHPAAMFNYAALIDDGIVADKTSADAANFLYESLRSGNEDVLDQLSKNPRMFKPATRTALQKLLLERDFYQGSIDGQFGPQTQRGLRKAYGLSE